MTDGTDNLGQDEIEELLRQASAGAAASPAPPREPPPAPRPTVEIGPPPPAHPDPHTGYATSDMDGDLQLLLNQAEEAIRSVDQPIENRVPGLSPFSLKPLSGAPATTERASLELLRDVELDMRIELGAPTCIWRMSSNCAKARSSPWTNWPVTRSMFMSTVGWSHGAKSSCLTTIFVCGLRN